jgi:MFS family permease
MTETNTQNYTYGKFLLASGVVIFAIGQSLLFIIVAPMARSIGLTELQFGVAFSLANLSLLFAGPFWGKRSDIIGRKPVFIIGLVGSAIGTLAMAIALSIGTSKVVATGIMISMIFGSRFLYGLTASAIYPSASGYIADVTDWSGRAKGMALIGSANAMGSILGPAIGGGLAFMGALFPMYAAAVISFIGALAALIWLVEPEQHKIRSQMKSSDKPPLKITDARLRPYMIMWVFFFVTFISLNFITAFYIQDRFEVDNMQSVMRIASLMLASMAIVITLVQGVLFQLVKISPQILLRICAPIFALGLFTLGTAVSIPMLGFGFALIGAAFACATPGINGSASLKMAPHEQGAAAGYLSAANTMGAILGPVFGTSLYKLGPSVPMLVGGGMMMILTIFAQTIAPPEPAEAS